MKYLFNLSLITLLLGSISCAQSQKSYAELWSEFETQLHTKDKAPQGYAEFEDVEGSIKRVYYESDGIQLQALLDTSQIEKGKPKAAIVYLHGGFALGYQDVYDCQPFIDAGYIVFAPSYRGENGNDGYFELCFGEVADARAAINWLAMQEYIDENRIFVFGHSIGGAVSLALSLHPDLPIRRAASSAGLYDIGTIEYWAEEGMVPFDHNNKDEILLRLPVYTLSHMQRDHILYIGTDDYYKEEGEFLHELYGNQELKLILEKVKGDHFSSLEPAMKKFLKVIQ